MHSQGSGEHTSREGWDAKKTCELWSCRLRDGQTFQWTLIHKRLALRLRVTVTVTVWGGLNLYTMTCAPISDLNATAVYN
jgi:hypothetical protein